MKVIYTKNSGRPPVRSHLRRVLVAVRLPQWLVDWLGNQPGTKTKVVESALMKAHKLRVPKKPFSPQPE